MAREKGRDRDERDDERSRNRGDARERGRDRDVDSGRREYGKISPKLMDILKHDQQQARSRSGGNRDWYQLKDGMNLCRILPSLDPEKPFYVWHKVHYQVGPNAESFVYCPKTLGEDEECPICEYVELTVKEGKHKKEVAAATEMKAGGRWLAQVLDRDEDDDQPKLFGFSQTIYNGVMDLVTGKYPDILEFENGYDINIKKEGKGRTGTRYTGIYPEKDPTPVNPDVVDRMIDLNEYVAKRIFSAKELERILDGDDPMDVVNSRDGRDGGKGKDKDRGRGRDEEHAAGGRAQSRDEERPRGREREDERDERRVSGNRNAPRDDDEKDHGHNRDHDDRGRGRADDDDRGGDSRDRDRPRGRDREDDRGREQETRRPDRDDDRDHGRSRGTDDDDRVSEEMDRLARESGASRGRR